MPADLHCHTTASDGSLTPSELVHLAKHLGLQAIGITDHDTVDGIPEALAVGSKLAVQIVPGVELNTDYEGVEVHVLGYYPDLASVGLQEVLVSLRDARTARVKLILQKLNELGLRLEEEQVFAIAGTGSIGRPHVAQAMQEKGYVANTKEAFSRYIGIGKPAYVSRFKLTPAEGIKIIRQAKGIAVLAHPGLVDRDDIIPRLIEAGLSGIEVYHTNHTPAMEDKYTKLARDLGLLATGGSDYHGRGRKEGIELGDRRVDMVVVEKLMKLKEEIG